MRNAVVILMLFFFSSQAFAQDDYYQLDDVKDTSRFFIGFNIGGHFPNKNTAIIYTGRPSVTQFGIPWIFDNPFNQQAFNDHFQYPFRITEYPQEPTYRSELELGVHAGYEISKKLSVFVEVNAIQMSYEQFFTITIDDPNNQSPGDVFRQIPIIGEENRFHFNLGGQFNYFQNETQAAYVSFFGNMNNVSMRRNYIIINSIEYPIIHIDENRPDLRPGGIGFGFGAGLGFRFVLTDHILMDPYYQFYRTQINMSEAIQPIGMHHSLGIRILWN
tara:strand:+ start:379 stop:1200 length:822 start_codon:yes stop_codon:yes gene_type:complete